VHVGNCYPMMKKEEAHGKIRQESGRSTVACNSVLRGRFSS